MRTRSARRRSPSASLRALLAGIALAVPAHAIEAQTAERRSCDVLATVIGGGTGLVLGGFVGGRIEKALYEGEDAGLTGALLGGVAGAVLGVTLAKKACDRPDDSELRRMIRSMTTLRLVPYDAAWPARYAAEAARVRRVLGDGASIEHVGSTAVPGLAGKPVLDIAVAVDGEAAADAGVAPLQTLGYEYRGPHGDDPRRRYYVRNKNGVRAVQLHLYVLPASGWEDMLFFRDALRADAQLASDYAAEKYRIADAVGWDKHAYATAKGRFVERVVEGRGGADTRPAPRR